MCIYSLSSLLSSKILYIYISVLFLAYTSAESYKKQACEPLEIRNPKGKRSDRFQRSVRRGISPFFLRLPVQVDRSIRNGISLEPTCSRRNKMPEIHYHCSEIHRGSDEGSTYPFRDRASVTLEFQVSGWREPFCRDLEVDGRRGK